MASSTISLVDSWSANLSKPRITINTKADTSKASKTLDITPLGGNCSNKRVISHFAAKSQDHAMATAQAALPTRIILFNVLRI